VTTDYKKDGDTVGRGSNTLDPTEPDPATSRPDRKLERNSGSDTSWPILHDFSFIAKSAILILQKIIKN